jgi:hypothetical protein
MPGLETVTQDVTYEWYCNGPTGEPPGYACGLGVAEPTTMITDLVIASLLSLLSASCLLFFRTQGRASAALKSISASMVLLAISFFLDAFEHGYGRELKCIGGPNTMQLCQRYSYLWIPILLSRVSGVYLSLLAVSLQALGGDSWHFSAVFALVWIAVVLFTILVIVGTIVPVELLISMYACVIFLIPPLFITIYILAAARHRVRRSSHQAPGIEMALGGWIVVTVSFLWNCLPFYTFHEHFNSNDVSNLLFSCGIPFFCLGFYNWAMVEEEQGNKRQASALNIILSVQQPDDSRITIEPRPRA